MEVQEKTILIINEEEEILTLLKKIITGSGMHCVTAKTAEQGLLQASIKTPQLIIVASTKNNPEGIQFLNERKQNSQLIDIPTLAYCESTKLQDIQKAVELGASDYLIKPIQSSILLQKIRKYLRDVNKSNSVKFNNNQPKVNAQISAELIGISDEHILFSSNAKINGGQSIQLNSSLINAIEQNELILKVDARSTSTDDKGQYITKARFVGLSEEMRKALRFKIGSIK